MAFTLSETNLLKRACSARVHAGLIDEELSSFISPCHCVFLVSSYSSADHAGLLGGLLQPKRECHPRTIIPAAARRRRSIRREDIEQWIPKWRLDEKCDETNKEEGRKRCAFSAELSLYMNCADWWFLACLQCQRAHLTCDDCAYLLWFFDLSPNPLTSHQLGRVSDV
jgi:hypothetical protein